MLVKIIASYLQIDEDKVAKLLELLSLENAWQEEQEWKGKKFNLSKIRSQADLINFLQAVGQSRWFKGHDYSKFSNNISDQELNKKYFTLFRDMGLTTQISYDKSIGKPEFSAVLGASESQVRSRVESLKQDILNNTGPSENMIFGLGCNRELGVSVLETEQDSKNKLQKEGKEATEMNMVNLIVNETMNELTKQNEKFKVLSYQEINTTSNDKTREEKNCVKTSDTALSLKQAIESQYDIAKMKKPINTAVYSCQPFVLRQQRDVQQKMGSNYNAVGVGCALTFDSFNSHPKSISTCLGEVARLININYTPENLKKYDIALTKAELEELKNLVQEKQEETKISRIPNLSHKKDRTHLPSNIIFSQHKITGCLTVTIETKRLYLESVTPDYLDSYCNLFNKPDVVTKFADGKTWDADKTKARVNTWVSRWQHNDPFSSFAVSLSDNDQFIGHVVLGYGDDPGQSELAYIFKKSVWGERYGTEAVSSVVKEYAPQLVQREYKLEGKPFSSITATSRTDNPASIKILQGVGMKSIREEVKFGNNRHQFFITTDELVKVSKQNSQQDVGIKLEKGMQLN